MTLPLIHLDNVTKVYQMGNVEVPALRGVSLAIDEGEFVAVTGPSGSGKSTLMHILGCLDRPTEGSYRFDGQDVSGLDRNALAEIRNHTLGFVFQTFHLLARTSAEENVELPLLYAGLTGEERRRRARAALHRVGLADRMHHYPNQLSGGQQQRVAIARALVNSPRVIFADEPTGNLDTATGVGVMELFRELGESGITIVVVTHEAKVAGYARRALEMRDGLIASDGAPPGGRA